MPKVQKVKLVGGMAAITIDKAALLGLCYEGVPKEDVSVQFYGPLRSRVSMANVSFAICDALKSEIDGFAVHNYLAGDWIEDRLLSYAFLNKSARVGIFLGDPDHIDESFYNHPIKIGGFVCETDEIGRDWVRVCNRMDLVFVPSRWCQAAFKRSGVRTPVMVVPHGLEPEYRPYSEKTRDNPFVFYNTFRSSSLGTRKGMEELIRSFLRAFDGRDDVVLRLRTDESKLLRRCRDRYEFGNLVRIEPFTDLDTESFARLYGHAHCTVHPSKGEGFGLIPFQSVACETPVIAPHTTGMADYLTPENSIALRTAGRVAGEKIGNRYGTYFSIDEDHLVYCLRYMFDHWETEYAKVRRAGAGFRRRHVWDVVLKDFVSLVRTIARKKNVDQARRHIAESFA